MKELYHEEQKILSDYVGRIKKKAVNMEDAVNIAVNYKDLLDQSKVITRISDRLQKKLDHSNQKIKSQNVEIQKKNKELDNTIDQLTEMTVGKKATRIMFVLAVVLFISEEQFLAPVINEYVGTPYISLGVMLGIAMLLKFFEGWLEGYFLKQQKNKILIGEQPDTVAADINKTQNLSFLKSKGVA